MLKGRSHFARTRAYPRTYVVNAAVHVTTVVDTQTLIHAVDYCL